MWFYHFYFRLGFFFFFLLIWSQLHHPFSWETLWLRKFLFGSKAWPEEELGVPCVRCPWARWEQDMAWAAGAAALSLPLHGKAIPFPFCPAGSDLPGLVILLVWRREELSRLVTKHSQLIKSFLESSLWSLFRFQSVPVLWHRLFHFYLCWYCNNLFFSFPLITIRVPDSSYCCCSSNNWSTLPHCHCHLLPLFFGPWEEEGAKHMSLIQSCFQASKISFYCSEKKL